MNKLQQYRLILALATAGAMIGAVLAAMGRSAPMDEIIERTGLPADIVLAALTMLELQGLIAQRPGNYYEKQR